MSAGEIIKYCRNKTGLTVKDLSKRSSIGESTIRSYESQNTDASWTKMEQLLKACGYRITIVKIK